MQPVAAYSDNEAEPNEGTRRFVYQMPGGSFMVLKIFLTPSGEKYTVKIWDETVDYQRTVRSWRTKHKYMPSIEKYRKYFLIACGLIERCGFAPFALVNRR